MAINFIPIILVGGAIAILRKKKRRSRQNENKKSIHSTGRGTIFDGDSDNRPSVIRSNVGERFSIKFRETGSAKEWSLKASPPDGSVYHVITEHDKYPESIDGISGSIVYVFEGLRSGKGSLVFHSQIPQLEGKEPPEDIVEILTEIS